jgi:hypothetical protein
MNLLSALVMCSYQFFCDVFHVLQFSLSAGCIDKKKTFWIVCYLCSPHESEVAYSFSVHVNITVGMWNSLIDLMNDSCISKLISP